MRGRIRNRDDLGSLEAGPVANGPGKIERSGLWRIENHRMATFSALWIALARFQGLGMDSGVSRRRAGPEFIHRASSSARTRDYGTTE